LLQNLNLNTFTSHICFCSLLSQGGRETKKNYLTGRGGEKVKNHCATTLTKLTGRNTDQLPK